MYQVTFTQVYSPVEGTKPEGYPVMIVTSDLERALALASMLQKIGDSAVVNSKVEVIEFTPVPADRIDKFNPIKFELHEKKS